jgi:hypothetical protein
MRVLLRERCRQGGATGGEVGHGGPRRDVERAVVPRPSHEFEQRFRMVGIMGLCRRARRTTHIVLILGHDVSSIELPACYPTAD